MYNILVALWCTGMLYEVSHLDDVMHGTISGYFNDNFGTFPTENVAFTQTRKTSPDINVS